MTLGRFHNLEAIENPVQRERIRIHIADLGLKVKSVLNGRWWLDSIEHFCFDPATGQPCCESAQQTRDRVAAVFAGVFAFMIDHGNEASDHDWFKSVHAAKGFCFGGTCH